MNYELIERLAEEWRIAIGSTPYGGSSKSEDQKNQYWNTQAAEYDLRMFQDYRRIDHVLKLLESHGVLNRNSKVLDLGCGTGNYTLELARRAKTVIGIDRSEAMGQRLQQKAAAWEIENVTFLQRDWNLMDIAADRLEGWADVTLSALNPSINTWNSLNKINLTSHNACCLVTFAGSASNPVRDDISELLTGRRPGEMDSGYNVCYPYMLLYQAGFRPEVTYVPMSWVKEHPYEAAVKRICEENVLTADTTAKREKIEKYVQDHLDSDGIFRETNETLLGVLFWRVRKQGDCK